MARAYAVRRPVVNTYLVRERDRRRLRELGSVVLAVTLVGLCGLGYLWLRLEVLRAGYRLHDLEAALEQRQQVERRVGVELSRHVRPQEIERRAIAELGMRVAEESQLISSQGVQ